MGQEGVNYIEKVVIMSPPLVLKIDKGCQTSIEEEMNNLSLEPCCPRCLPISKENIKLKTQIDEISNLVVELQGLTQNHFENMQDRVIINEHWSDQLESQLILTQQFQKNT
tara:strand:- start:597 stop:929 length:333 start_codon:yes stop_codon:yes gene_type:complete